MKVGGSTLSNMAWMQLYSVLVGFVSKILCLGALAHYILSEDSFLNGMIDKYKDCDIPIANFESLREKRIREAKTDIEAPVRKKRRI